MVGCDTCDSFASAPQANSLAAAIRSRISVRRGSASARLMRLNWSRSTTFHGNGLRERARTLPKWPSISLEIATWRGLQAATSRLVSMPRAPVEYKWFRGGKSVEMSLDAADTSVRATMAASE